jgi:hypothetical protein
MFHHFHGINVERVKNGFVITQPARGDVPGDRHVFTNPQSLGEWVETWAQQTDATETVRCPH